MSKVREIKQGDIYMVEFTGVGNEQKNSHPSVVVSCDAINSTSPNVVVFPITHRTKKHMPYHYVLNKSDYPFFVYSNNTVQPECMQHVAKQRLLRCLGRLEEQDLKRILERKEYVFVIKDT